MLDKGFEKMSIYISSAIMNQIFRDNMSEKLSDDVLYNLLDQICLKKEKYYFLDETAYRKMLFHNLHTDFIETLRPHYHNAKVFYLDREFTYNSFTNIVRQVCKHLKIGFESEIKFCHSKYYINFFISPI